MKHKSLNYFKRILDGWHWLSSGGLYGTDQKSQSEEMFRDLLNEKLIIQLPTEIHEQKKYQITSEGWAALVEVGVAIPEPESEQD